jgi:hypothetical protein
MTISRTLLRPIAYVAGLHARHQAAAFLAGHRQTRRRQDELLARLIAQHAATGFGRDHQFLKLKSYDDFRSAVPVRTYEALRPYIDRVFQGQTSALLPPEESVLMFAMTSGTTGEPKHIPVTRRFLADIRRGWNIWGSLAFDDHPEAWLRAILQISSPMNDATSPAGLPCGAVSGLLALTQKGIVRRMYVVPPEVSGLSDPPTKYYSILRCGVGRDVAFITTANPSSTIALIETGQAHVERLIRDVADGTFSPPGPVSPALTERLRFRPDRALARRLQAGVKADGALLPRHFWNLAFLANWTGGTLKLYLPRLRELFGGVPVRDIGLLASEGRFSIPIADGTAAGLAEITSNFLEFIPAEDRSATDPPILRADEVEVGREYFLVVTNWAGLWRYNLDDRVRVVDRHGQSPVFEFLCRGLHTASMTGEKITEHQVVEAMRCASDEMKSPGVREAVERFVFQGRFDRTPCYELRLEPAEGLDAAAMAESLDRELGRLNMEYAGKRSSGRLGPIRVVLLPPGWFARTEADRIAARHGRGEQYKHQYLLTDVIIAR